MQQLTAPPRDHLTEQQVRALLTGPVQTAAGCELLAPDLSLREDISDDLVDGTVERQLYADVHGTCRLQLSRALAWGVDLVRPYMLLSSPDGTVTARFNAGVYLLTTPTRMVGTTPETYSVTGEDRLALLRRQVGMDYTVPAGQTYRQALLNAISAAGLSGVLIDGAAADNTLPATRVWPLVGASTDPDQTDTPVTWLRIVNDLARAINFRSVWCDEDGRYRLQAYRQPSQRAPEWTFDADDLLDGTVGQDREVVQDLWNVPNRWVFRQTNRPDGAPPPTVGDGVYVYPETGRLQDGRDLTWTSVVDLEAASQAKLVELGLRKVAADLAVTAQYQVTVGPFPPAGHADVYRYLDAQVGGSRLVQLVASELDLLGADTRMRWEDVT